MLDEAVTIGGIASELQRIGLVAAARAETAWLAGDDDAVADATETALELARRRRAPWIVGELAYWRYRAGLRDGLAEHEFAEPYSLAIAGEWNSAAQAWERIGCPYEHALALTEQDESARRIGVQRLDELGARRASAAVIRRSRGGRRPPRTQTQANPAGLTDRELEVLILVAGGLRDAEIAQHLFISCRTVNHHVSAVLAKLRVLNRGQASVEALRLGLLE